MLKPQYFLMFPLLEMMQFQDVPLRKDLEPQYFLMLPLSKMMQFQYIHFKFQKLDFKLTKYVLVLRQKASTHPFYMKEYEYQNGHWS